MEQNNKKKFPLLLGCVITFIVVYVAFKFVSPVASAKIVGKDRPLPLPGSLMMIYMILTTVALAIFVTTSQSKINEFKRPLVNFLKGGGFLRLGVLIVMPLLVGGLAYQSVVPRVAPPVMIRVQHPTLPGKFEPLQNPFRKPTDEMVKKFMEEKGLTVPVEEARGMFVQHVTAEGRDLFQINCRPCHGSKADGNGPMAWGFRLRPADFTDPGTIATVVEPYLLWRINEGAMGLPAESSPWDSAMPAWKGEIPEDDMWKIILADYDTSNKEPRKPEKIH